MFTKVFYSHEKILYLEVSSRLKGYYKVCCKGYSITLPVFKKNEGRVQGT